MERAPAARDHQAHRLIGRQVDVRLTHRMVEIVCNCERVYPVPYHECQHSIFDRNPEFSVTDMACASGAYVIRSEPRLGSTPADEIFNYCV